MNVRLTATVTSDRCFTGVVRCGFIDFHFRVLVSAMRLNVLTGDEDAIPIRELADAVGVSRAARMCLAIRAGFDSPEVAQVIAAHTDKTGWGEHCEVAGRPRAKTK